ncbi:hypothetical protein PLICRDRAFT_181117 [Plicaturopsis crispa FD-325 SS-3]|uniref:Uncharacterized protein n=1 Tax=Plicaturopsis crispa FD-325 SS-3 TaxID=944288 RepID=A0A0C9T0V1_PLICR|nr:hypothetical protein PLICRDRAFT_181117 [Plicaturopsis crispa FD-325 SS-3]
MFHSSYRCAPHRARPPFGTQKQPPPSLAQPRTLSHRAQVPSARSCGTHFDVHAPAWRAPSTRTHRPRARAIAIGVGSSRVLQRPPSRTVPRSLPCTVHRCAQLRHAPRCAPSTVAPRHPPLRTVHRRTVHRRTAPSTVAHCPLPFTVHRRAQLRHAPRPLLRTVPPSPVVHRPSVRAAAARNPSPVAHRPPSPAVHRPSARAAAARTPLCTDPGRAPTPSCTDRCHAPSPIVHHPSARAATARTPSPAVHHPLSCAAAKCAPPPLAWLPACPPVVPAPTCCPSRVLSPPIPAIIAGVGFLV